ncbi:uncharacterized protein LOC122853868 [Aphidius gifuensis]|uniref:uncharacterized protein LOC122853868 n=1 Tax=Aphidius gifuensis TaxID=684658 RepID=UPI001CDCD41A|nr:uncharacterized protein LOC122853868 [Aphidius gifuensis]
MEKKSVQWLLLVLQQYDFQKEKLYCPLFANSTSSIKIESKDATELKDVDMLLWDEGPMAPRYCLESGDRLLRDITNIDSPFGGKIMLIGSDFRQLLPVKVDGTRSEIVNLSIKNSKLWKYFTVFSLTKNMRTLPNEVEFAEYYLKIGNGILNNNNNKLLLPDKCLASRDEDIVQTIFKDLIDEKKYSDLSKVAVLSARNADINKTNKYLNSLNPPKFPSYELKLRNNCSIMLLRNISKNEGDQEDNIVFLHRITLYCENIYPFTFKRRQFPIKIPFVMIINKSQGQTFNRIRVDIRENVFNRGQLYVAFSRVRSW